MATRYRRPHPYAYANQALHTIREGVWRAGQNLAQQGAQHLWRNYRGRLGYSAAGYALKGLQDEWRTTKRFRKPWGRWNSTTPTSYPTATSTYRHKLRNISSKRKRIEDLLEDLRDDKRPRKGGTHPKRDIYYGSATPFLDLGFRGTRRRGTLKEFLRRYRRTYN
jgi:hypothetical protein